MANEKARPSIHSESFPSAPMDNEMRGATVLRLVFREQPPVADKPFDDPANAPSEEITLACEINARWGKVSSQGHGRQKLAQEIYKVDGWGFSNVMNGPIRITLNPKRKSEGATVAKGDRNAFPAESHFDMYIQVTLPDRRDFPPLENSEPIRIVSPDVKRLPPLGNPFVHNGQPIALRDTSGTVRAWAFQGKKNLVQLLVQKAGQKAG